MEQGLKISESKQSTPPLDPPLGPDNTAHSFDPSTKYCPICQMAGNRQRQEQKMTSEFARKARKGH